MLLSDFNFITIHRPSMVITQGTVLYPPNSHHRPLETGQQEIHPLCRGGGEGILSEDPQKFLLGLRKSQASQETHWFNHRPQGPSDFGYRLAPLFLVVVGSTLLCPHLPLPRPLQPSYPFILDLFSQLSQTPHANGKVGRRERTSRA